MPREILPVPLTYLARLPFWLFGRRPFVPPQKALILQPGSISQVMLTTPLLAALSRTYPKTRFDWAINDRARPAIVGNPRLTEIISIGSEDLTKASLGELQMLAKNLEAIHYDTCFIPHCSSLPTWVAWQAKIPQRIGLNVQGRGFAHTLAVRPPAGEPHEALLYLSLAVTTGIDLQSSPVGMEFYPSDADRTAVTRQLVDEIEWLGDSPLVVLHPGGGSNANQNKQWPVERFALVGSYLSRQYKARVLLVGAAKERPLLQTLSGMMAVPTVNLAGRLTLGELGALCEVADLYVGNNAGPTYTAAAVGCPTIHICGPDNPAVSSPYITKGKVVSLWREGKNQPFSWQEGVTVEDVCKTADTLLKKA